MRVCLNNRYDELERLATCLQAFVHQWSLGSSLLHDLTVCADELVTNAIAYAWPDTQAHTLILEAQKHPDCVRLVLSYEGQAFNPFKTTRYIDTQSEIEERLPGGLGIHIVESLMTRVEYTRKGDQNIITLEKSTADA